MNIGITVAFVFIKNTYIYSKSMLDKYGYFNFVNRVLQFILI